MDWDTTARYLLFLSPLFMSIALTIYVRQLTK